jgi:hypothetical protein
LILLNAYNRVGRLRQFPNTHANPSCFSARRASFSHSAYHQALFSMSAQPPAFALASPVEMAPIM